MTEPREPAGELRRLEDAKTGGQLYNYAEDLEDVKWLSNDDKRRLRSFVNQALDVIQASRLAACRWYQLRCRRQVEVLTGK